MFDTPANFSSSSAVVVGAGAGLDCATGGLGSGRALAPGVPGAGGTGLNGCRSLPCAKAGARGGVDSGGGGGVERCDSSPCESGNRRAKSSAEAFRAVQCETGPLDEGGCETPAESRRRLAGLGFAAGGGGRFDPSAEARPGSVEMVSYRETREEMAACRLTDWGFGARIVGGTRGCGGGASQSSESAGMGEGWEAAGGAGGAKRWIEARAGPRSISPSESESTR